jgi:hypothetical protein
MQWPNAVRLVMNMARSLKNCLIGSGSEIPAARRWRDCCRHDVKILVLPESLVGQYAVMYVSWIDGDGSNVVLAHLPMRSLLRAVTKVLICPVETIQFPPGWYVEVIGDVILDGWRRTLLKKGVNVDVNLA